MPSSRHVGSAKASTDPAQSRQIIKRYKKSPASLNLTLFPTHFRIEQLVRRTPVGAR